MERAHKNFVKGYVYMLLLMILALLMVTGCTPKAECNDPSAYQENDNGQCQYRKNLISGSWVVDEIFISPSCNSGNDYYTITIEASQYTTNGVYIKNFANMGTGVSVPATVSNNNGSQNLVLDDNFTIYAWGSNYDVLGGATISSNNQTMALDFSLYQNEAPYCVINVNDFCEK